MRKRPGAVIGAMAGLYLASALLLTALMPRPHGTLQYVIAGAFATGVCLGAAFYLHVKSISGRAARRDEK